MSLKAFLPLPCSYFSSDSHECIQFLEIVNQHDFKCNRKVFKQVNAAVGLACWKFFEPRVTLSLHTTHYCSLYLSISTSR